MGREDTDNATDIPDTDTDPSNKKPFSKSRGHRITTVNNHERRSFSKFQLKKINKLGLSCAKLRASLYLSGLD